MNRRLGWFAAAMATLVLLFAFAFLATGESLRADPPSGHEAGRALVTQQMSKRAMQDDLRSTAEAPDRLRRSGRSEPSS